MVSEKDNNMLEDRNYYRMLSNKELIQRAQEDSASELALVLAERLTAELDISRDVEDEY